MKQLEAGGDIVGAANFGVKVYQGILAGYIQRLFFFLSNASLTLGFSLGYRGREGARSHDGAHCMGCCWTAWGLGVSFGCLGCFGCLGMRD